MVSCRHKYNSVTIYILAKLIAINNKNESLLQNEAEAFSKKTLSSQPHPQDFIVT
jgi:hypothetical protein